VRSNLPQNIYDRPDFFEGYSQLGRSVEGLDGAMEWSALRAMLPDMSGLRVVDLGCGFGWFCRWAREQRAAQVVGLDLSEKMLARARATTSDSAIIYERADLEQLDLPQARFDLAYSSLAPHYIKDATRLFGTIH
jgi:ubiquinone/menaquinone biosynthesis C-methylase UbiE